MPTSPASPRICEGLAPEPLIAWLDRYIDTMAGMIMAHDGVLLRFIGDGILAVFGVPIPRRDEAGIATDANNAARCALAMEQAMEDAERRLGSARPAGRRSARRPAHRPNGRRQPGNRRANGVLPAG